MKKLLTILLSLCISGIIMPFNVSAISSKQTIEEVIAVHQDYAIYLIPVLERQEITEGTCTTHSLTVEIPIDSNGNLSASLPQIGAGWDSSYSIYATVSYTTQINPNDSTKMKVNSFSGWYIDQEPTVSVFSQKIEAGQNTIGGSPSICTKYPTASLTSFTYYPTFSYINRVGSYFGVNYWITMGRNSSRTWSLWLQDGVNVDVSYNNR